MPARKQVPDPQKRHNVYVVELCPLVLSEKRFMKENASWNRTKSCVYVGMTGLAPMERFLNHKRGHKANKFVQNYGTRLLPEHYEHHNPLTSDGAKALEIELAARPKGEGYAAWSR